VGYIFTCIEFLEGVWYTPPSERNGLYQNRAGMSTNIFRSSPPSPLPSPTCSPNKFFGRRERLAFAEALAQGDRGEEGKSATGEKKEEKVDSTILI
jgi:hypothetical protein